MRAQVKLLSALPSDPKSWLIGNAKGTEEWLSERNTEEKIN